MESFDICNKIQDKINQLENYRNQLLYATKEKSEKIGEYEKILAKTIISLKNGGIFDLEGEKIQNPAVSIIEKLAKGICYKEKIDMDLAETQYKNIITNIECIKAQLNGYQSINKTVSEL